MNLVQKEEEGFGNKIFTHNNIFTNVPWQGTEQDNKPQTLEENTQSWIPSYNKPLYTAMHDIFLQHVSHSMCSTMYKISDQS